MRIATARKAIRGLSGVIMAGSTLLLLGLSTGTFAQGNATLSGTVTDITGAIIPGAAIMAVNDTTGMATTQVTNALGEYQFTLQPGLYTITVEAPGFETGIYSNVALRAGPQAPRNFTLEVGPVETNIVVGTRAEPRSVTESTVPVDTVSPQEIMSQGNTDLSDRLRTVIPSYNVSVHPIADAAAIVRPASLRNLSPEHTLVLVNGKRRHRSSVIAWQFGPTIGNHGPDISTIPSIELLEW